MRVQQTITFPGVFMVFPHHISTNLSITIQPNLINLFRKIVSKLFTFPKFEDQFTHEILAFLAMTEKVNIVIGHKLKRIIFNYCLDNLNQKINSKDSAVTLNLKNGNLIYSEIIFILIIIICTNVLPVCM